jgi:hypothetical protein
MRREAARFARKLLRLPKDYLAQVEQQLSALPPLQLITRSDDDATSKAFEHHLISHGIQYSPESIRQATEGKRPILILGASGTRWWDRISKLHQMFLMAFLNHLQHYQFQLLIDIILIIENIF